MTAVWTCLLCDGEFDSAGDTLDHALEVEGLTPDDLVGCTTRHARITSDDGEPVDPPVWATVWTLADGRQWLLMLTFAEPPSDELTDSPRSSDCPRRPTRIDSTSWHATGTCHLHLPSPFPCRAVSASIDTRVEPRGIFRLMGARGSFTVDAQE